MFIKGTTDLFIYYTYFLSKTIPPSLGLPADLTTTNTVTAAACLGLYLYNRPTLAGQPLHNRAGYR